MKRIFLFLIILFFTLQGFSQKQSDEIYIEALKMHIKSSKTQTLLPRIYYPRASNREFAIRLRLITQHQ
jgi:hypothetical protein